MPETAANLVLAWLCLLQPALAFAFGLVVGRHGLKHGITLILLKLFGQPPAELQQ